MPDRFHPPPLPPSRQPNLTPPDAPLAGSMALASGAASLVGSGMLATPSALQLAQAIAGTYGTAPMRMRYYQVDRLNNVIADLSQAALQTGQIDCDNDRAVPRTIKMAFDAKKLPQSFLSATTPTLNVAAYYELYLKPLATWVAFQKGIFWIDKPQIEDTPATSIWQAAGSELTYFLTVYNSHDTYVVPAGSNYLATVNAILGQFGFQSNIAIGSQLTPVDFPWAPKTPWLQIINDLLLGINYYPIWTDDFGIFQTAPRLDPAQAPVATTYSTAGDNPAVLQPLSRSTDLASFPNCVIAAIDDPSRPAALAHLMNMDPASPLSIPNTGFHRGIEIRGGQTGGTKCMLDAATLLGLTDFEVRIAAAQAQPAKLLTYPDPQRGNHEFYTVTVGGVVTGQQYRVANWSLPLVPGAAMTHTIQKADAILVGMGGME